MMYILYRQHKWYSGGSVVKFTLNRLSSEIYCTTSVVDFLESQNLRKPIPIICNLSLYTRSCIETWSLWCILLSQDSSYSNFSCGSILYMQIDWSKLCHFWLYAMQIYWTEKGSPWFSVSSRWFVGGQLGWVYDPPYDTESVKTVAELQV